MEKKQDELAYFSPFVTEVIIHTGNLDSIQKFENEPYHIILDNMESADSEKQSFQEEEKPKPDKGSKNQFEYMMKMTGENPSTLIPKLTRSGLIRLISEKIDQMEIEERVKEKQAEE